MPEIDTTETKEMLGELCKHMPDTPIAAAHGVAAIALSLAMKYHDINTVQDGALYQQYKLEGRNMTPLHLDMVFDTAAKMELWLLGSSNRIAKIIVDAVADGIDRPEDAAPTETTD